MPASIKTSRLLLMWQQTSAELTGKSGTDPSVNHLLPTK